MNDCFGIIYRVTNEIDGKTYIGQTVNGLAKRKWSHESRAISGSNNIYFWKSIKKYGKEKFDWKIIEYCKSKEELDLAEEWYIRYYKTFIGFKNCCGYNLTLGGEGNVGYKHTKEICKLIAKQKTGIKLSDRSIVKRSALQSYIWKIIYPDGKIKIIRNLSKFCRSNNLGLCPKAMSRVAAGRRSSHKEFRCEKLSKRNRYLSDEAKYKISVENLGRKLTTDQIKVRTKAQSKFWLVKLPTGQELKIQNLKKYCRENRLNYSSMCRISRGERKTHSNGYSCIKLNNKKYN